MGSLGTRGGCGFVAFPGFHGVNTSIMASVKLSMPHKIPQNITTGSHEPFEVVVHHWKNWKRNGSFERGRNKHDNLHCAL